MVKKNGLLSMLGLNENISISCLGLVSEIKIISVMFGSFHVVIMTLIRLVVVYSCVWSRARSVTPQCSVKLERWQHKTRKITFYQEGETQ